MHWGATKARMSWNASIVVSSYTVCPELRRARYLAEMQLGSVACAESIVFLAVVAARLSARRWPAFRRLASSLPTGDRPPSRRAMTRTASRPPTCRIASLDGVPVEAPSPPESGAGARGARHRRPPTSCRPNRCRPHPDLRVASTSDRQRGEPASPSGACSVAEAVDPARARAARVAWRRRQRKRDGRYAPLNRTAVAGHRSPSDLACAGRSSARNDASVTGPGRPFRRARRRPRRASSQRATPAGPRPPADEQLRVQ